jgi:hypothetical protein
VRSDEPTRDGAHEEALLIPWYCNGTLARDERERLERHLESCQRCREDLALWRSVEVEVSEPAAMPVPHPAQLQRLLGRLDEPAEEAGEVAPTGSRRRGGSEFRRLPRRWRLLVVGQAAALAALVGWTAVARLEPPPVPAFRTLSARAIERPTWRLRAVFSEQTPEKEMRMLLLSLGAAVVDGPSPLGVYTVEIPATLDPDSTIAVLRTRPEVRFAELAVPRERR